MSFHVIALASAAYRTRTRFKCSSEDGCSCGCSLHKSMHSLHVFVSIYYIVSCMTGKKVQLLCECVDISKQHVYREHVLCKK